MKKKKIVIPKDDIANRVKQLGKAVTKDYTGTKLLVVGVMKGAFIFMADLVRQIDLPLEIDFIRAASYGRHTASSGNVTLTENAELSLADKDVLLVEDIIDTGRTAAYLKEILMALAPRSFKICALIDKKERREVPVDIDYKGFTVQEGFLVGYGLDFDEQHRNYPDIYTLDV